MKFYLFVLTIFTCLTFNSNATTKRVLFIGNSYTGVNNLPNTFYNLCLSLGDSVVVDVNSPGGYTFNQHSTNATTISKIMQGNWDFVVLQEQSQLPSFHPTQVASDCYPYAKILCDTIKHYNPCAEVLFYMTWGRKNGDAGNCANYPPVCTYAGMQQRLRESYLEMTDSNNASCAPVGAVWNVFRNSFPNVELYSPDESHPSLSGTYLAACTFYSSIFSKASNGASYLGGVIAQDAASIQSTASQVVLDSLENWQQYGGIPAAKFAFTNTLNNFFFTNQSLRYSTTHWDFGDGTSMTNTNNPSHVYSSIGNYIVTLSISNDSCLEDKFIDTVQVTSIPSGFSEVVNEEKFVQVFQNKLTLANLNKWGSLEIYASNGQLVRRITSVQNSLTYTLDFVPGVYIYRLLSESGKLIEQNKFSLQ